MTTETTIQTLAAEALSYFEYTGSNPGNGIRENIYVKKDDTPEWVSDLVYEAHGSLFPDDYVYQYVVESLEALAENDDEDEARETIEADIYTGKLLEWLASHLSRQGYVDEAVEEFGYPGSIVRAIQLGQYAEREEVFESVLSNLEQRLDEVDDDTDEE